MAIREKIELILESKKFEQGLSRAQRRFRVFAEKSRNALGGGRTGGGARGRARGGLLEGLSRGGGALGAMAGGFGAAAVVSQITGAIQNAFNSVAERQRNVAMRGAGPAGSQQNALAQMQAAAVQTRKVIFGVGDAFEGIITASLGTEEAFSNWKESLMSAVNATDDYAKGLEILKRQEGREAGIQRRRAIGLVRQGEGAGLVSEGFHGDEGKLIRQIESLKSAAELKRFADTLKQNLEAGRPLATPAGAMNAGEMNWRGFQ